MIGHITKTELRRLLSANDTANGFANRILWVRSDRVRLLPDGGDIQSVDFSQEVKRLCLIAESSRRVGEVKRTPEAGEYWHDLYINELSTGDAQGIWGQVTDRAEAQRQGPFGITPSNRHNGSLVKARIRPMGSDSWSRF